ncbi:MAG: chloride channel protein [Rhodanobacteraceae bacterium]
MITPDEQRPTPDPNAQRAKRRLKAVLGHEFFAPAQWQRRVALWTGGVLVGLAAIVFTKVANLAYDGIEYIVSVSPFIPLAFTPAMFGFLAWVTKGKLKPTRGSGIPEVSATLGIEDKAFRDAVLSLPVAIFKMVLTLLGLLAGASVGREGPTVHVGAGLMYWLSKRFKFDDPKAVSRFILAGGAAGIAGAFNAPLAGIVFAIEELAGSYEHRMSGIVMTTVIFAGVVSLGVLGDYTYFGKMDATLSLLPDAFAVLLCGVCGGIGGGLFSRLILLDDKGPLGWLRKTRNRWPVLFAAACGLALALIGIFSAGAVYGTGYAQARDLVHSTHGAAFMFGWEKLGANILSYWAGIPGGIFSPALAAGAGMGHSLAILFSPAETSAVVLLGMAAFLAGVTQAPITSAIISLEMTANQTMVIPILAACLLARGISSLFCSTPVYRAFANQVTASFEQRQREGALANAASPSPP